jgi:PBSX family phage portal protein
MSTELIVADQAGAAPQPMAFSFGDPEPAINGRDVWSYFEMWQNGRWYEPPFPMISLAKAMNASPHHRSAVALKVNLLVSHFIPSRWLDRANFEKFALDFIHMGNAYLEQIDNLGGRVMALKQSPAVYTRVGVEPGTAFFVKGPLGQVHEFGKGKLHQILQPDVLQEIYGVPEWLAALQSALLNENATMFRRRYYLNGAHAGFILHVTDTIVDKETEKALREALKQAKGLGNFKNLFLYTPGGKKEGVQIIPIADVAAKDEFFTVKNVTRDDMLAAHRTPPQVLGIIPQNNGGFGDVGRAMDVFFPNEIVSIQDRLKAINDKLGVPAIEFRPYEKQGNAGAAGPR